MGIQGLPRQGTGTTRTGTAAHDTAPPAALLISQVLVAAVAALAVVLAANLVAYQLRPRAQLLDLGTRPDRAAVAGFHGNERDAAGTTYRWTNGDAVLSLYGPALDGPGTLALDLGWLPPGAERPRAVALSLDGVPWGEFDAPDQPRSYKLLLPSGALADGVARIGLRSETTVVSPDDRPLGVRVDAATLGWPLEAWPLPPAGVLLSQAAIALIWLALARLLGVGLLPAVGVALAIIAGLVAHSAVEPHLAALWQTRLFGAAAASGVVIWGASLVLPRAEPGASRGFLNALLLITLAALAVRLMGVLYPLFFAHDLLVNSGRLRNVQLGDLTLFDRPSEFSRRVAVVSPTAFVLAAPYSLLGDRRFALQFSYALLDALTPLLVGLLALRLGVKERGALLAAALIALLPMQLTALYWGFVKQIVGQLLTLLFLVVVAGREPLTRLGWTAATVLCAVNFLIHPGGLLLSGVAMGLFLLIGLWPRLRAVASGAVPARELLVGEGVALWRGWLLALLAASALALAVQYVDAARLMIGGMLDGSTATPDSTNQQSDTAARLWQIWVGLNASFAPLPLALVALALGALIVRAQGHGRALVLGWLGSALLFLGVDIALGQQVRYGYFSAPIVCAGVAALLEPLLPRRIGRAVAWGVVALVAAAGLTLWAGAIFAGVKPSVNPLTH